MVNDALAVGGLLVFPTFDPERPDVCTFGGSGYLYALFTANADPLGGVGEARATPVEGFASEAIVTSTGLSSRPARTPSSIRSRSQSGCSRSATA